MNKKDMSNHYSFRYLKGLKTALYVLLYCKNLSFQKKIGHAGILTERKQVILLNVVTNTTVGISHVMVVYEKSEEILNTLACN